MLKKITSLFARSTREAAESSHEEPPSAERDTSVRNPELKAAIERLHHEKSDEAKDALLAEVRRANLLAAVIDNTMEADRAKVRTAVGPHGAPLTFIVTSDEDGRPFLPLFTDVEALRSYTDEPVSPLVLSPQDLRYWALTEGDYAGVVVNPAGKALPLSRRILELLASVSQPTEETRPASRSLIHEALVRLMSRENGDAFVIFVDQASGKFVQFAGGAGQNLYFDLPAPTLDPDDMRRAEAVLAEYGIEPPESEHYDAPGGDGVGRPSGFGADLGHDIARGADIAWRVFLDVYELSEGFAMTLEEN